MVCQACYETMPFNLPNGSPYFEAAELLGSLAIEQSENHFALCPTCAAKWQYANPVTDTELRVALAAAESPKSWSTWRASPYGFASHRCISTMCGRSLTYQWHDRF
jgi:hypothetical protein